ncbi:TcpQ domain-containing protein [Pusillimonas sp. NJUB218]|uniref:TcpQ domain-containing protein n=1 Tax=Pusillimonas sp. NJUB218 TaxID=2023230 RepID=UPI0013155262|nr:TcpQ domain-containing protein [Pusillimonas sp. NJUB218]
MERVSFSWPEQPVKAALPEPKLAVEALPELNPPKEANAQPVSLAEVKSESPLYIASSLPSDAKATDQGSSVRTSVKEQQDTNATPHSNSEPVPGQVEQGNQPEAVPLNKTDDLESAAPKTEALPEPEPVPEPEPAPPLLTWSAQAGMTLSEMLSNWGADQGWIVRWASEADYRIEAPFSIQAPDFLAAASHVFNAYRDAGRSFNVTAYANQVLVVKVPTD